MPSWLSSYSAARRPLWKRRDHFALPFSNFLQMTISAEAMAFLFSSTSSVEASAFCPAFSNFLQMTISADAMVFFPYSAARPLWKRRLFALPFPIFCR
jgi:hypothetical protein